MSDTNLDKLTAIKIKYDDSSYSDSIPVGVFAKDVEWDQNGHTLKDTILGEIDFQSKGTVQEQLNQLFLSKVNKNEFNKYIDNLNEQVEDWLSVNIPLDTDLNTSGKAADAGAVGIRLANLNLQLSNINNAIENVQSEIGILGTEINQLNDDLLWDDNEFNRPFIKRGTGSKANIENKATSSSGDSSHAEGIQTKASGDASHAEGYNTVANHRSQHVFGQYNIEDSSTQTSSQRGSYIEIVGNGTLNNESNARTLDWDGNEVLAGKLTIGTSPSNNKDVTTKEYVDNLASGHQNQISGINSQISGINSQISNINTTISGINTATSTDINKALCPKTITNGKVTQWQFRTSEAGGGVSDYYELENRPALRSGAGSSSIIENNATFAAGNSSHAEGDQTQAYGHYSHVEGYNTRANGDASHAEGYGTIVNGKAGHAQGESTNAGQHCHAEGYYTEASGSMSHAEGDHTIASESDSHAEGYQTLASGKHSHAEGYNTQANASASHAEGSSAIAAKRYAHAEGCITKANGEASHAQGYNTKANGNHSHAEGSANIAEGNHSHAEGGANQAIGDYSHAEGYGSQALGVSSHAEGCNTDAVGYGSHAEGGYYNSNNQKIMDTIVNFNNEEYTIKGPYALGNNSHAEGCQTFAGGYCSHAEGYQTKALGDYSCSIGRSSVASGISSTAIGENTIASADQSTAMGSYTEASGSYSTAIGNHTKASGVSSIAMGSHTIVSESHNLVIGKYNKATRSGSGTNEDPYVYTNIGDYAFIIGNGTDDATAYRSNALTVDWEGNLSTFGSISEGGTLLANKYMPQSDYQTVVINDVGYINGAFTNTGATINVKYCKFKNIVTVSGEFHTGANIVNSSANISEMFRIPQGFEPNIRIYIEAYADNGATPQTWYAEDTWVQTNYPLSANKTYTFCVSYCH